MEFSFHYTDLEEGLPRVLPYPLSSTAIYLRPDQMPPTWAREIAKHGGNPSIERGRWIIEIRDERVPASAVAYAVIAFESGSPVTEVMSIYTGYARINLQNYMETLGDRLWGVCEPCS